MRGHLKNLLTHVGWVKPRQRRTQQDRRDAIPRMQRGFLLITAVILIVIVALLATVITFLTTGNVLSSASHANSAKALFVAESGMERALLGFKAGTACASLSSLIPPSAVGEGDFSILGTLYNPATPVTIAVDIGTTDTVIPVSADPRTSGYATHGRLTIGTEALNYAGVATTGCSGAPACFTGVTRAVAGTTAVDPVIGDAVLQNQCVIRSTGTVNSAKRIVERAVSAVSGSTSAIMVYAKESSAGRPFYRLWDNTTATWGAEQQASSVGGNLIEYIIVKSARTRNETIVGTLDNTGNIRVQIWNGSTWSDGTTVGATRLMANIGGNNLYRGFDIEYETSGDRAIVVYSTNTRNPSYQIWNGASWTVGGSLSAVTELNGNYTSSANIIRWIELASDPKSTSNNMALFTLDDGNGVYGVYWNGTRWQRMSASTVVWGTTAVNSRKPMDVAYEQNPGAGSSRAMFIWGTTNSASNQQQYRVWDSSTLGAVIDQSISSSLMSNTAQWCRLAAQPGSNNLMYVVQDSGRDLNSLFWNGGAFGSETNHDARTEAAQSRNYDFVFETYPANVGDGWLVWGTATGSDQIRRRRWNGGGWDAALAKIGDDTAYIRLLAHPVTGAVFSGIYESSGSASDDIREIHLTNGSATWSALTQIWNGGVVGNPVMQRVAIAPVGGGMTIYDWLEFFQ